MAGTVTGEDGNHDWSSSEAFESQGLVGSGEEF